MALAFPFEHLYSNPGLGIFNLKGPDLAVVDSLIDACTGLDFFVLLGILTGHDEHSFVLDAVYTWTGDKVASNVAIDRRSLLESSLLDENDSYSWIDSMPVRESETYHSAVSECF